MGFLKPKPYFYIGKAIYGCPYMFPYNYNSSIIKVRFRKSGSDKIIKRKYERNYNKSFIFFNYEFNLTIGYPIVFRKAELGWKDKFNTPRHEWNPQFHIYFIGFQFSIWWGNPLGEKMYDDLYWEMWLWTYKYNNGDIVKAKETWGWFDSISKKSTWNDEYIK